MLCPEGYSGIRDQREILCAAADCLALGVHAPWEGEAPAEPNVSVQFSVSSSQCPVLSVQFSVFSNRRIPPWEGEAPAEPDNHTTR
jgi:hypothetical protein